ncbi:MAG: 3-phosphoglycerate dehydrogenase [Bacteroidales bacterium]|nr:3-phosphoglycerate dehydrogenase [Bacteroidales bacterium]
MTKVLIATEKPFAKEAIEQISAIFNEAGFEIKMLEKYKEKADLLHAVADVNAIIIRSDIIDKEVIDAAPQLKIVVRAGAGYDNVDLKAASDKNVVVMNTPGQNANAVAELAVGMMIYLIRNGFNGTAGTELRNKKLGIHAYGAVGRIVGLIGKGLGMKVFAFDPFIDKIIIENDGVQAVDSAEALYSKCQYISLHIPANDKTKNSIGYELLNTMPKGAMLVNTARKEVIDEAGLLRMFEKRDDFKYASDIAPGCEKEIAEKYCGRYFFTPKKMGAQTAEANINAGVAAARQIVGFITKGDKTFQVN